MSETASPETVMNVGSLQVANVYAEALLNLAWEQVKGEPILDQLDTLVHKVFQAQPQLETFLSSRVIRREEKERVIRQAFGGRADPLFVDFLLVLNQHNRLDLLRAIWAEYRHMYDQRQRRVRVQVRSAAPLSPDQEERLKAELKQTLALEPILVSRVDPDMLGGLVVQVGDWLFDASIRTHLGRLRNQLLARSSHEIESGRDRFSHPD